MKDETLRRADLLFFLSLALVLCSIGCATSPQSIIAMDEIDRQELVQHPIGVFSLGS